MPDPTTPDAAIPVTPPQLPDVESPAPEEVLEGVPSKDQVISDAEPASEIVEQQPGVDELLGRR